MSQQTPLVRVLFPRTLTSVMVGGFVVFGLLSITFASILTAVIAPQQATAATNSTLNFQARLETASGSIVPDGYYNVQFKLYDVSSAGTALWTETWYDSNGGTAGNDNRIQVRNGYVTANLGSQTAFPGTINWDQDMWVTMNIGGTTQTATPTWDGEMNPRLKLTGVPYAFKAGQLAQFNQTTGFTSTLSLIQPTVGNQVFQVADQGAAGTYNLCIQNSTACGFAAASGSGSYIQNQNAAAQTASNFWISGTGTADTFNAATALQTAGVTRLDASGNLANIGTIAASGNITTSGGVLSVQGTGTNSFAGSLSVTGNISTSGYYLQGGQVVVNTTTGSNNSFFGVSAGNTTTTGSDNTAAGNSALRFNTTGNSNTAAGNSALLSNTTGSGNTAAGNVALFSNTTGSGNTAAGNVALFSNTTGFNNTAAGSAALYNLATLSGSITATASNAGQAQFTTSSTAGLQPGLALTIAGTTSYNGARTIASVDSATTFTITTAYSTADAAGSWTSANPDNNTASGTDAGYGNAGSYTATGNSLFGYQTGFNLQSGASYNTLLGYSAGSNITTGTNNIIIGANVSAASATASNQLNIGNAVYGDLASGTVLFKNTTNSATAFQIQNAAASAMLTMDTASGKLTINQGGLDIRGIANPAAPNLTSAATGGSLAAATYTYRLAAVGPAGETQAVPSNPASVTTSGTASVNTLGWTTVAYATQYAVYRSTDGGTTWYVQYVGGGVTSIADDGVTYAWTTAPPAGRPELYANTTGDLQMTDGSRILLSNNGSAQLKSDSSNTILANYATGGSILMQGDNFIFQDTTGYNVNFIISNTGATTLKNRVDTATAFQIQNAAGTSLLAADTAAMVVRAGTAAAATIAGVDVITDITEITTTLRVGNATDGVDISGATGVSYRGTARPTVKVSLLPEFPGATMTGDGSSNLGSMTSDFCSGTGRLSINTTVCAAINDEHNYYAWTTTEATAQDYDVYLRYQVPSNFSAFQSDSAVKLYGWRSTAGDSVQLSMFQANGTQCGATTTINSADLAWQQTSLSGTITGCAIAAGDTIVLRIRLTATNGNVARAGALEISYRSKF